MRKDREKKKVKLILPIFIIGILVLSVFGVVFGGIRDDDVVKYNGIVFKPQNDGYVFEGVGGAYKTVYTALEVEGFYDSFDQEFLDNFNGNKYSKMYLDISDLNVAAAANELYLNFQPRLQTVVSCSEGYAEEEHCLDLPLISCENSDENVLVVMFSDGEESNVYEDNCLELSGNVLYLTGVVDSLIMGYAGVFDE